MVNLHLSEFEQAIKFAEEMPLDGLMKSSLYRYGNSSAKSRGTGC